MDVLNGSCESARGVNGCRGAATMKDPLAYVLWLAFFVVAIGITLFIILAPQSH